MLQRYEQSSFSSLKEQLLQAGIAPRHVRRYIRELDDHFSDLVALQKERGYEEPDASLRARALLGDDADLTDAMLATKKFRALSAKAPWLVFGLLPPVMLLGLQMAAGFVMAVAGKPLHGPHMPLPAWCAPVAHAICMVSNYGSAPLVILFMLAIAWRQRMTGWWPVFGVIAAGMTGIASTLDVALPVNAVNGEISLTMGIAFPNVLQTSRFIVMTLIAGISLAVWTKRRHLDVRSFA